MYPRRFFLLIIILLLVFPAGAQKSDEFKQHRILILLDGSSSMVNPWTPEQNRFKAAGNIITRLMDSIYQINNQVEFSLRVYGHQHSVPENNCFDTRREVMFSKNNLTQMALRLESLHPIGVSPIAFSLKTAAETDFTNERDYSYSLILITDGGESCGGDICEVVKSLLEKKIQFRPYIVSLVDFAPLKDQYACMGTYLQVSKPSEVVPAIGTITEAYRKLLAVPVAKPKLLEAAATSKPPSVLKISTAPIKAPAPDPEPMKEVVKAPPPKETVAVAPPPAPKNIQVDTRQFIPEYYTPVRRISLERISYALFWSTATPKKQPVPHIAAPPRKPEPVTTTAPVTRPVPRPAPKPAERKEEKKEAVYTTTTSPSEKTSLEIYLTDGKGKYYTSTPPMQLIDIKTGAEVKKFFRTTDASGKPDPQMVPPGNYTLVLGKTGNYVAKNITIQPSNTNKVTIVVTKGSLSFAYETNLKRPVSEFIAAVKKNFEPGPTIGQKGTDQKEYEPGNYHIEINTLPVSRRTVDLDFGVNVRIDLDEPGYVQFTNSDPKGKISLYYPLGDQFVRFYGMEITGNPEEQKLRLQPGIYEAHFKKHPNVPVHDETIQRFIVKSNDTTSVELQ